MTGGSCEDSGETTTHQWGSTAAHHVKHPGDSSYLLSTRIGLCFGKRWVVLYWLWATITQRTRRFRYRSTASRARDDDIAARSRDWYTIPLFQRRGLATMLWRYWTANRSSTTGSMPRRIASWLSTHFKCVDQLSLLCEVVNVDLIVGERYLDRVIGTPSYHWLRTCRYHYSLMQAGFELAGWLIWSCVPLSYMAKCSGCLDRPVVSKCNWWSRPAVRE